MDFDDEGEDAMEETLEELDTDDEPYRFLATGGTHKRNLDIIRQFLGKGKQVHSPIIRPRYYGDLLAWALQRYLQSEGWKVAKTLGYYGSIPRYTDVNTDYDKYENVLCFGSLLLQKEDNRVVASIKADSEHPALLVIASHRKKEGQTFAEAVGNIAKGQTLYLGKKLQLGHHIRFLSLPSKSWHDLTLDPSLKDEIYVNTVGFLNRTDELARYGIPPRRGVMLVGEPGTGKTLISKILMNHSPGITCIVAHESGLTHSEYIDELYELAQDLNPSIVFIEDVDLIAEDRRESHYSRGQALSSLLSRLDGVEECTEVVTVATTNFLENIDKALRERPSRFDRIIQLPSPAVEQRNELIQSLSQRIPMDEDIQDYLARRTMGFTPAQIQEVAYSLVIERKHSLDGDEPGNCEFSRDDVDNVMAKMNRTNREMGFRKAGRNGDGSGVEAV